MDLTNQSNVVEEMLERVRVLVSNQVVKFVGHKIPWLW